MFTGLIEKMGTVKSISRKNDCCVLEIENCFGDIKIGDSIAVNGVCLTAREVNDLFFTADVMPETMKRSSLREIKRGDYVNLERAMRADGRFGGHIVSGHIDTTAKILRKTQNDNAVLITFAVGDTRYMVEKGSVAIDGISLTIVEVNEKTFSVSVIPHTLKETILSKKDAGDVVNIEFDLIAKYIEKLCVPQRSITEEFLKESGFYGG